MRKRLFNRHTWATPLYALADLPLAILGAVCTLALLAIGVILTVTPIGLWVIAAAVRTARWFATRQQRMAHALLDDETTIPEFSPAPGILGWRRSILGDRNSWLAVAYVMVKLPVAALDAVICLAMWLYGFLWLFWPILRNWDDVYPRDSHGVVHRGLSIFTFRIDTFEKSFILTAAGILLLLAAAWTMRHLVVLDRLLIKNVLGTDRLSERVGDLERSRAFLVDDSAARLRRIERDLHDGAQARLVALGMNLVMVKETLRAGTNELDAVYRLLDVAQDNAKAATAELRDLVRGIHPPVLDQGLDAALGTLAANSAIQVTVTTDIPARPSAAIETMTYFCASELLTNAAKHSGAKAATVDVRARGRRIVLRVADAGRGGAGIAPGGGLAGLAERVHTVDGGLTVDSPPGGPTVVTVDLPLSI
jgi:signal transduction histidine kinase